MFKDGVSVIEGGCAAPVSHRRGFQQVKPVTFEVPETAQVAEWPIFALRGGGYIIERFPELNIATYLPIWLTDI
jgi:hypothetical protein